MESFGHTSVKVKESGKSLFLRILPDIFAFVAGLGAAYFLKWDTKDLVWSLWLCSLVLGYLTLLGVLAGGAVIGFHAITHKDFKQSQLVPAILMGVAFGLFFLGFFSLHFGGFHAVHSVFLQQFFPIQGMPDDGFGAAFVNPPLLWVLVFQYLMTPYGFVLIPAIIAERQHVFMPLIRAVKAVRMDVAPGFPIRGRAEEPKGSKSHPVGNAISRPYINVVRMHLLIFFFAFAHFLKLDSFLVYAVVSFVYFFPWSEVKKRRTSNQQTGATV